MNQEKLKQDLKTIVQDVLDVALLQKGDTFVLGCSSSEVVGGMIGKNTSEDVGDLIVSTMKELLDQEQINLAVQGCEHLNRSLVVERAYAKSAGLDEVFVIPALNAGGAATVAAFKYFEEPVVVEHIVAQAGLDIGDTAIGMHVKYVQVPVRPSIKELGSAHVTALRSRPKYIGGPRAQYNN
ncbi:TIGR01440 family protein [Aerococcaceae bacterium DSM 111021]|nr:TIGR01440 family protein [Aerococcaceae bacterium DSM 111021]